MVMSTIVQHLFFGQGEGKGKEGRELSMREGWRCEVLLSVHMAPSLLSSSSP